MRVKPRTKYQWQEFACQMANAIQTHSTDSDLKGLAYAIQVALSFPSEIRSGMFEKMDRLLDQVNGINYETVGAKHIREFTERTQKGQL